MLTHKSSKRNIPSINSFSEQLGLITNQNLVSHENERLVHGTPLPGKNGPMLCRDSARFREREESLREGATFRWRKRKAGHTPYVPHAKLEGSTGNYFSKRVRTRLSVLPLLPKLGRGVLGGR
jgi:hypothetical protein